MRWLLSSACAGRPPPGSPAASLPHSWFILPQRSRAPVPLPARGCTCCLRCPNSPARPVARAPSCWRGHCPSASRSTLSALPDFSGAQLRSPRRSRGLPPALTSDLGRGNGFGFRFEIKISAAVKTLLCLRCASLALPTACRNSSFSEGELCLAARRFGCARVNTGTRKCRLQRDGPSLPARWCKDGIFNLHINQ